jgi:outer membrane protein assembly factor BamB
LRARGRIAGIAFNWEAASIRERWKRRLGGNFSGSAVLLGDRIYASSEAGETHVFRASPDRFESLAVNRLGDESWATPTICGDRISMRVVTGTGDMRREKLVCIGTP